MCPLTEIKMTRPLPSDAEIASLVNGIYAYPGYAPVAWDYLHISSTLSGVTYGIKRFDDVVCVIFRGSVTMSDWIHDLIAIPFRDSPLGFVHPGFYDGIPAAWADIKARLSANDRVIVAGHSLGAARAALLAGQMTIDGRPPARRVCFGEPRPGFRKLSDILRNVPSASYRNSDGVSHDIITDVPAPVGAMNYMHPCPLTDVCERPAQAQIEDDVLFAWHNMGLYLTALQKRATLHHSTKETRHAG